MAPALPNQPRARGEVRLAVQTDSGTSRLKDLRQAGSLKVLFPRSYDGFQAVLVNTAGGVTGGDAFHTRAEAHEGARLTLTTQASERAYKAQPASVGQIRTELSVAKNARLNWIPQETILFQQSAVNRSIRVDLERGAELTLAEPLIFGRKAMGEDVTEGHFRDLIEVYRDGQPLYRDAVALGGDIHAHLARPHIANGARAMVTLIHISSRAETLLPQLREMLPDTGGASVIGDDLLVLRALASDGFELRKFLIPILTLLTENDLPRPWMI